MRSERDQSLVTTALQKVTAAAKTDTNVMPAIIEAVQDYATVGEITNCLVEVFGRFDEPVRF